MRSLENKVALVTGAATGIGQSIAVSLARQGARVFITGRSEKSLNEAAAQHEGITALVADVGRTEDVTRVLDAIRERTGQLDIVVNNAGMAPITPLA